MKPPYRVMPANGIYPATSDWIPGVAIIRARQFANRHGVCYDVLLIDRTTCRFTLIERVTSTRCPECC